MKHVLENAPVVRDPSRNARRIAVIYMAAALLWLTFSDHLAARWVADTSVDPFTQWWRGCIFIVVSGALLYFGLHRIYRGQRKLYQHLEHSERAYRAMFEHNPNPMYIYDPTNLRFMAVNQAAITKYGFSRDDFMTMTLWEIRPPEARPAMQRALDAHKHFRDVVTANAVTHWTKDRRLLTMEVTGYSLQFEHRDARLVLARDVSEHVDIERQLRRDLRAQREALRIADIGCWTMVANGGDIQISARMQTLLDIPAGSTSLNAEQFFAQFIEADRELLQRACQAAWQGTPLQIEARLQRRDGELLYVLLRGEVAEFADDRQLIGTALDITSSARIERQLRDKEKQYREMAELLPEALLIHSDAHVLYANSAAANLFGVTRVADMLGVDIRDFIALPSQADALDRLRAFQQGEGDNDFQERLLRKKNGDVFTALVAAQTLSIDGRPCIQVQVRDISQQKKTQSELQTANARLQHLSEHMAQTTENERRQLSRELHDDLGQSLTFIKMTSAWLRKRQYDAEQAARIAQIHEAAGDALDKVRNLALAWRPAQLDALGLKPAMEEHLHKFFGGSGIGSAAEIEDLQPRPQPLLEMAVFRVFQEALTNILRHSDASFVRVVLTRRDGVLHLQIVDDGRGFDVAAAFARDNGLGLRTMRERAQQAHGELTLNSVAGFGTELTATFAEQEI